MQYTNIRNNPTNKEIRQTKNKCNTQTKKLKNTATPQKHIHKQTNATNVCTPFTESSTDDDNDGHKERYDDTK